jgi:sugar transferase (PEP-CTERM/EpsH1 system associated)
MEQLIFLAHRIPFPPNKGEKIRAYHLLRELSAEYEVHLGAFVDTPEDWASRGGLEAWCGETHYIYRHPRTAALRALSGFMTGRPLSVPYYASRAMHRWVRARIAGGARRVLVYSSAMAQFAEPYRDLLRIADFVDVDSAKWRSYADDARWPWSYVYRREGSRMFAYERAVAESFDAITFVSDAEAAFFRKLAPEVACRVAAVPNGVDAEFYDPAQAELSPYPAAVQAVVFTGAMDYRPNVDAVSWFAAEMLPTVRALFPNARFFIVGARPSPEVRALAELDGVSVIGAVEDIRPYVWHAAVSVAPLRIARGVQNKVLEAMAAGRPVVCTDEALAGIDARHGEQVCVASDADSIAAEVAGLLGDPGRGEQLGRSARARVMEQYDWAASGVQLRSLIQAADSRPQGLGVLATGEVGREKRVGS